MDNNDNFNLSKYEQALYYEIFVKEEYGVAKEHIKKTEMIFDIGGHIGLFSERCLTLNSKVKIQIYEAFPQNLEHAKQRLKKRKDQISYFPYAIAKQEGNQIFFLNKKKTMQSSKESSFLNPQGEKQEVRCIPLSKALQEVEKIDLLKIDIEGMEFEVLDSISQEERGKIGALLCEIHLLDDDKKIAWTRLKGKLKMQFQSCLWTPSTYTEKIGLYFCHNR